LSAMLAATQVDSGWCESGGECSSVCLHGGDLSALVVGSVQGR
jgi:hypothetical protein